jgi:hypothetical protein
VCLWSESEYELKVTENTTETVLEVGEFPVLSTVQYAKDYLELYGYVFETFSGTPLSNSQISRLLLQFSSEIISLLGHNIVLCTYKNRFRGKNTKSVFTSPGFGISLDFPFAVKRKNYFTNNPTYSASLFNWNKKTGELNYIPFSNHLESGNPFNLDNEIVLTFTAGFTLIPEPIMNAVASLTYLNMSGLLSGVKSLAGGSFKVDFGSNSQKDYYNRILVSLRPFKS